MIAPPAPTLTAGTTPCPNVEVYFPTLSVDVATITVYRIADGVKEAVAGALRATASGDFVVVDYQVPFGVVSTYVGEVFDSLGASLLGASGTITVNSSEVWFQAQADPTASTTIVLLEKSFQTVTRKRNVQRVFVVGLPRPFEQHFGLGGIESLTVNFITKGDAQADAITALQEYSPLLIRTPPKFSTIPRLLSCSVQAPAHNPLDWQTGNGNQIVWIMSIDEVQPLSKAILRPLVTWDDWIAAFPSATWTNVMAVWGAGTWTDMIRNGP